MSMSTGDIATLASKIEVLYNDRIAKGETPSIDTRGLFEECGAEEGDDQTAAIETALAALGTPLFVTSRVRSELLPESWWEFTWTLSTSP